MNVLAIVLALIGGLAIGIGFSIYGFVYLMQHGKAFMKGNDGEWLPYDPRLGALAAILEQAAQAAAEDR